ncbi:MAG: Crp/Fnr family transcriptional regulator [Ectothiorhodospiraceae bacterium]|nr:Crp/Fnr family transcriptional regulator [Ectothiorhodospiraceae bacterium]
MSAGLRSHLLPLMEQIPLARGAVLYESGAPQRHVYFPTSAITSVLYMLEDGASAEISLVGNDGMIGTALISHVDTTPSRAIVITPGAALRISAKHFYREMDTQPELMSLLLRYIQILFIQTAQTAVCYRHHSIRQQICWLRLEALDRLPCNKIAMTHELIANVLGVRREGVTEAARRLQQAGVIQYARGQIAVLDRERLEKLSCECYGVVKRETERVLKIPMHHFGNHHR